MKIYCKNCKWYKGFLEVCNIEKIKETVWLHACKYNEKLDYIGNTLFSTCAKYNLNSNCKYYKCKLYKFWIKEK